MEMCHYIVYNTQFECHHIKHENVLVRKSPNASVYKFHIAADRTKPRISVCHFSVFDNLKMPVALCVVRFMMNGPKEMSKNDGGEKSGSMDLS